MLRTLFGAGAAAGAEAAGEGPDKLWEAVAPFSKPAHHDAADSHTTNSASSVSTEPVSERIIDDSAEAGDGGGEALLEQLLQEDGGVKLASLEIDVERELVGKLIGYKGNVIQSIRRRSCALIALQKHEDGSGTLTATGTAKQLYMVATCVKQVKASAHAASRAVATHSRDLVSLGGAAAGAGGASGGRHAALERPPPSPTGSAPGADETEYVMPLPPREAALLETRGGPGQLQRLGVRVTPRRTADGWLELMLRGPAAAVEAAKASIEQLQCTPDGGFDASEGSMPGTPTSGTTAAFADSASAEATVSSAGGQLQQWRLENGVLYLSMPNHWVGKIIGRRGATIQELRDRTGAIVEVVKHEEGSGTVSVAGQADRVRIAREAIDALLSGTGTSPLPSPVGGGGGCFGGGRALEEEVLVHVPQKRVGKVIGSRGAVIQALRRETGAAVDLQKEPSGSAIVTLRGPAAAVQAAKLVVDRIIASDAAV